MLDQFSNKDWKIRKKGADELEAILKEAGMRIENNGLNDLMGALKKCMADSNKASLKACIAVTAKMAEALGPPAKSYLKKNFAPMLDNISDK